MYVYVCVCVCVCVWVGGWVGERVCVRECVSESVFVLFQCVSICTFVPVKQVNSVKLDLMSPHTLSAADIWLD